MGDEVDEPSFVFGYLLGRRRPGADLLALEPGSPSTMPRRWRWVVAASAVGGSVAVALLWWDLTTGVGWLRTALLALVATGVAMWSAETVWERRAPTVPSTGSRDR